MANRRAHGLSALVAERPSVMDERTTGLILRTRPFTETSLIVHWLTPEFGRMATIAKGARRPKSPFQGKLDLFYLADFTFRRSRRSELHVLHEVSVRDFHAPLRKDLRRLQQAAYCAHLVEQTTETDTPLPALFRLFTELLAVLTLRTPQALTVYAFEAKLLQELGLTPDLAKSRLTLGARQILERTISADWPTVFRIKLSAGQDTELRAFLLEFLGHHLEKVPRSRNLCFT